jgi:hypothetical protein
VRMHVSLLCLVLRYVLYCFNLKIDKGFTIVIRDGTLSPPPAYNKTVAETQTGLCCETCDMEGQTEVDEIHVENARLTERVGSLNAMVLSLSSQLENSDKRNLKQEKQILDLETKNREVTQTSALNEARVKTLTERLRVLDIVPLVNGLTLIF